MANLATHFEITISQPLRRELEALKAFELQVKKHRAELNADYGEFYKHELERIVQSVENLSYEWKRKVVNQINEQFKNSEYLNGMIAVREMPFTKAMSEDEVFL